jgi:hypothetical protein
VTAPLLCSRSVSAPAFTQAAGDPSTPTRPTMERYVLVLDPSSSRCPHPALSLPSPCPHPALTLPSPCPLPALSLPSPCPLPALSLPPCLLRPTGRDSAPQVAGELLTTILAAFAATGYRVSWRLLNARRWVAQKRLRLYITGVRNDLPHAPLSFPNDELPTEAMSCGLTFPSDTLPTVRECLEPASSAEVARCALTAAQWSKIASAEFCAKSNRGVRSREVSPPHGLESCRVRMRGPLIRCGSDALLKTCGRLTAAQLPMVGRARCGVWTR